MSRVGSALRRIPPTRAAIESDRAQHLARTLRCARAVRRPWRFTALELLGPAGRTTAHRIADSDLTVLVRHRTRDMDIFREIFGTGHAPNVYDPPAPVAAVLDQAPAPKVLDLGGNVGLFGVYVLGRWPHAKVESFEPDPVNHQMLARTIERNGLGERWRAHERAIANRDGRLSFVSGLFAESQLSEVADPAAKGAGAAALTEGREITVEAADLFERDLEVELLKIDVEGAEWPILTDPRLPALAAATVLVLEWHASGCPDPDPRSAAIAALRAAGFEQIEEGGVLSHSGMVWAWHATHG